MQVDDATRRYLAQEWGMTPLRTSSGCAALAQALATGRPQVLVAEGERDRLKTSLLGQVVAPPIDVLPATTPAELVADDLHERTLRYLLRLLSATLKLPPQGIDAHARLEAYGIDSVMVLELTAKLENAFGALPKTLFFEYQTIASLADYFLQRHRDACLPQ